MSRTAELHYEEGTQATEPTDFVRGRRGSQRPPLTGIHARLEEEKMLNSLLTDELATANRELMQERERRQDLERQLRSALKRTSELEHANATLHNSLCMKDKLLSKQTGRWSELLSPDSMRSFPGTPNVKRTDSFFFPSPKFSHSSSFTFDSDDRQQLERELAQVKDSLAATEEALAAAQVKLQQSSATEEALVRQLEHYTQHTEDVEVALAQKDLEWAQKVNALHAKTQALTQELDAYKSENRNYQSARTQLEIELKQLRSVVSSQSHCKQMYLDSVGTLDTLQGVIAKLREKLSKEKKTLIQLQTQEAKTQQECTQLREQLAESWGKLEAQEREATSLVREVAFVVSAKGYSLYPEAEDEFRKLFGKEYSLLADRLASEAPEVPKPLLCSESDLLAMVQCEAAALEAFLETGYFK